MAKYFIWLMLPVEIEQQIISIKKQIDSTLKGPDFPPHLTIVAGSHADLQNLVAFCIDTLKSQNLSHPHTTIRTIGYEIDTPYFQSLYIQAEVDRRTHEFRARLQDFMNLPKTAFRPHISLYYGLAGRDDKEIVRKSLPQLPSSFQSTRYVIVRDDGEKSEDMDWKTISSIDASNI